MINRFSTQGRWSSNKARTFDSKGAVKKVACILHDHIDHIDTSATIDEMAGLIVEVLFGEGGKA